MTIAPKPANGRAVALGAAFVVFLMIVGGIVYASEAFRFRREAIAFVRWHGGEVTLENDKRAQWLVPWSQAVFGDQVGSHIAQINFNGTNIGDAEFADLLKYRAAFSEVRDVDISFTGVTDVTLHNLGELPNIEVLMIGSTATTDDGLRLLQELPNLRWIGLSRQHITAKGVDHLSRVSGLRGVELDYTSFRSADIVIEALPDVVIVH
jgi:hypothetical protein